MYRIWIAGVTVVAAVAMVLVGYAGPQTAAVPPVIVHPANLAVAGGAGSATWYSSNWSGYAETGHFTEVSGSWTVPAVTAGASTAGGGRFHGSTSAWYSAAWVGIDGFNDSSLIQTGTEQDYYNGAAHYSAWWEILPAAETVISYPVSPGDTMVATIVQTPTQVSVRGGGGRFGRGQSSTGSQWTITLADTTTTTGHAAWSFTTTQVYGGAGSSAEWIVEAPEVNGAIASISDYAFPSGSLAAGDFNTAAVATTIGGTLTAAGLSYTNDAGSLIQNGVQASTPGPQDPADTAFNSVYGATVPGAPTS